MVMYRIIGVLHPVAKQRISGVLDPVALFVQSTALDGTLWLLDTRLSVAPSGNSRAVALHHFEVCFVDCVVPESHNMSASLQWPAQLH